MAQTVSSVLPGGPIDPAVISTMQAYGACLHKEAIALESSDASVDDIFLAAKTACAESWFRAFRVSVADLEKRPASPTGKDPETIAVEILGDADASSKSDLRLELLRLRAARKSR